MSVSRRVEWVRIGRRHDAPLMAMLGIALVLMNAVLSATGAVACDRRDGAASIELACERDTHGRCLSGLENEDAPASHHEGGPSGPCQDIPLGVDQATGRVLPSGVERPEASPSAAPMLVALPPWQFNRPRGVDWPQGRSRPPDPPAGGRTVALLE